MKLATCKICGRPTKSKYKICTLLGCRVEYMKVYTDKLRKPRKPCKVCGRPTNSEFGVCSKLECRSEYTKERNSTKRSARKPCKICGALTRRPSGVCTRTPECLAYMHKPKIKCAICRLSVRSKYGVCRHTKECRYEFGRRRRAAMTPEQKRARKDYFNAWRKIHRPNKRQRIGD